MPGQKVLPREAELESLLLVSFMRVCVGDLLRIKAKTANREEYRDKIGAAADCLLVFKGEAKIGMVPHNVAVNGAKACRVAAVNSPAGVCVCSYLKHYLLATLWLDTFSY